jgi:hypothetical protein
VLVPIAILNNNEYVSSSLRICFPKKYPQMKDRNMRVMNPNPNATTNLNDCLSFAAAASYSSVPTRLLTILSYCFLAILPLISSNITALLSSLALSTSGDSLYFSCNYSKLTLFLSLSSMISLASTKNSSTPLTFKLSLQKWSS